MKTVKVFYTVNGQVKSVKSGAVAPEAVAATKVRLKAKALTLAQQAAGLTEPEDVPTWQSSQAEQDEYKAYTAIMEAVNSSITFEVAEA